MPLPSNAVPDGGSLFVVGGGVVVRRGSLRIRTVPVRFERTPWRARRYSRPERAFDGTPTTMRVELALFGLRLRTVRLPFASRTGKITRLARGSRRPASFTAPPGATVRLSVHARMHLTQVMCGPRARAFAAGASRSVAAIAAEAVICRRIAGPNKRSGASCGPVADVHATTGLLTDGQQAATVDLLTGSQQGRDSERSSSATTPLLVDGRPLAADRQRGPVPAPLSRMGGPELPFAP